MLTSIHENFPSKTITVHKTDQVRVAPSLDINSASLSVSGVIESKLGNIHICTNTQGREVVPIYKVLNVD